MEKCVIKSDFKAATWYEDEIKKMDSKILALKMSRPALRALVNANIYTVDTLRNTPIDELKSLHGMGPSAIKKIELLFIPTL